MATEKYTFSAETLKELSKLESYLREIKYHEHTIRQYKNCTGIYVDWLRENGYEPTEVTYKIVIGFISDSQPKHSTNHIRRIIIAIRHYHDALGGDTNPVAGIVIKGQRKSILNDIVDYKQLMVCYEHYEVMNDAEKRNKVMLGLMMYQGITTGELHALEPGHIRLREGKIYLPGHATLNSRVLDLEASQILDLQEYLLVIRPRLMSNMNSTKAGRKAPEIKAEVYGKLFMGSNGSRSVKTAMLNMFRKIKKVYPKVASGHVIRATVIAEWLKSTDVRKVQYMAGHRYVSSTERYNVMNLEELKDSLNKYHPLK